MESLKLITQKMIDYYEGDPKRVQHFLKVYTFADYIGTMEGMDEDERYVLNAAALVHDIGIKNAEEKYGNCNGKNQELEGPDEARKLLSSLEIKPKVIDRVCFLVGHHHTYTEVDGMDYQILLEADFLVNAYEDNLSKAAVENGMNKFFKTKCGIETCRRMFL